MSKIREILEKYASKPYTGHLPKKQQEKANKRKLIFEEDFDKLEKELEEYMVEFRWNKAWSDKLHSLFMDRNTPKPPKNTPKSSKHTKTKGNV